MGKLLSYVNHENTVQVFYWIDIQCCATNIQVTEHGKCNLFPRIMTLPYKCIKYINKLHAQLNASQNRYCATHTDYS